MAKLRWNNLRRRAVEAWVLETKGLMALSDWTVHFRWEGNEHTHPEEGGCGALATVTPHPSSKHVDLCVSEEFLELEPEFQRQVLVHELVHCHLFALTEYASSSFETVGPQSKAAQKLHHSGLMQQVELATDALADAFMVFAEPLILP